MLLLTVLWLVSLHITGGLPHVSPDYNGFLPPAVPNTGTNAHYYAPGEKTSLFSFSSPDLMDLINLVCIYALQDNFIMPLSSVSFPDSKRSHSHSGHISKYLKQRCLIVLLLLISGNIQPNPGPEHSFFTNISHASVTPQPAKNLTTFDHFCSRKSLGLLHINIRSLLPKLDELKVYVQTACPDVLVISESWLKISVPSTAESLPGYSVFRQDISTKGGGVAIYCKDSLQCSVILSRSIPKQFELVLLRINLSKNNSITVAGCYRPPSAPACALGALSELIAPIYSTSSEFVLLGDLNWDMLNPPTTVQLQLDALNLSQIFDARTRFNNMHPEKENGTLLDVILTNRPTRYTSSVF